MSRSELFVIGQLRVQTPQVRSCLYIHHCVVEGGWGDDNNHPISCFLQHLGQVREGEVSPELITNMLALARILLEPTASVCQELSLTIMYVIFTPGPSASGSLWSLTAPFWSISVGAERRCGHSSWKIHQYLKGNHQLTCCNM